MNNGYLYITLKRSKAMSQKEMKIKMMKIWGRRQLQVSTRPRPQLMKAASEHRASFMFLPMKRQHKNYRCIQRF